MKLYVNRKTLVPVIINFCCILFTVYGHAQQQNSAFSSIQSAIDTARINTAPEKIYMQFDKPGYILGDTIWFKTYLFNASYLTPSAQSGIMYIDIVNSDSVLVKQFRLPVVNGVIWGNIALTTEDFKEGAYVLRAYTSWMRNYGDKYFFFHRFNIATTSQDNWIVRTQVQSFNVNNNDSIRAVLQFSDLAKQPLADKALDLQVITGKKTLLKAPVTTTHKGTLDVNFTLPGKPVMVTLAATDKSTAKKIIIPLLLSRPGNIDLQFMPEGGHLVAGLPAHVGFKAIAEDGRGADVKGIIVNSSNQQVAAFQSLYKGMGSFDMLPADGETYSAKISLPGGGEKTYPLPAVQKTGITLQIHNDANSDSLQISVAATPGFLQPGNNLLLIAQARNFVCYGAEVNFGNGNLLTKTIAKDLFPGGIARFTLFNANRQPLNERLVFIDAEDDNMQIDITTPQQSYNPRDSVAVTITAKDEVYKPVQGNFSLAVTDDAQVNNDSLARQSIVSYMLLSSDLKGYIETPGYYFQPHDTAAWQALDNLLLTQGWAGYDWKQVFNPQPFFYQPEHEFMVKGRVSNVFNKGVAKSEVMLLSKRPGLLMDTTTDNAGRFAFNGFPALDTPMFVIQARNKHGRSFNVGVEVDEVKPPVVILPPSPAVLPWYVNSDTTLLALATEKIQQKKRLMEGMTLQEVIVHSIKKIEGSKNLNGPGGADQVLNEGDMDKAGKKSLLQLLQETVKGFHTGGFIRTFMIDYKIVQVVFDGININDFYIPQGSSLDEYYLFMKQYFDRYSTDDIKGIELNYSPKYTSAYKLRYGLTDNVNVTWTFLEITTYSGHGPFLQNTPGVYTYKSIPFSWPKKFYSPRYNVTDTTDHSVDARSTIYWAPNIVTDSSGKATLSFYAADKPATYTLLLEGTDFNGNVAVKVKRITITGKK